MTIVWVEPKRCTATGVGRLRRTILYGLLTSFLALVCFLAIGARAGGSAVGLGSYQFLTVLSGSMEPAIHTGDMIVVQQVDTTQLAVGDVIAFHDPEQGVTMTHRIVAVQKEADGSVRFVTRGDANDADDRLAVPTNRVLGRVRLRLPLLGYVSHFASSKLGFVLLIVLPAGVVISNEIWALALDADTPRPKKIAAEADLSETEPAEVGPSEDGRAETEGAEAGKGDARCV